MRDYERGADLATRGVASAYDGVWDAAEYLAKLSMLRGIVEEVLNAALAGSLVAIGVRVASLELDYCRKSRRLRVGVLLGLKAV